MDAFCLPVSFFFLPSNDTSCKRARFAEVDFGPTPGSVSDVWAGMVETIVCAIYLLCPMVAFLQKLNVVGELWQETLGILIGLSTDRAALDEYMGVWFRGEVPNAVELRSLAVIFHKELEERIESRHLVIDHLEKVKGCPTYGWLKRLKENHAEDLEQLDILNVFVVKMYATVRKRENDVAQMDY
ncbi:hypothetical protein Tco_0378678 [Tanacetum coccineum]